MPAILFVALEEEQAALVAEEALRSPIHHTGASLRCEGARGATLHLPRTRRPWQAKNCSAAHCRESNQPVHASHATKPGRVRTRVWYAAYLRAAQLIIAQYGVYRLNQRALPDCTLHKHAVVGSTEESATVSCVTAVEFLSTVK